MLRACVATLLAASLMFTTTGHAASKATSASEDRWAVPGTVIVKFKEMPPHSKGIQSGFQNVDRLLGEFGVRSLEPFMRWVPVPRKATKTDLGRIFVVQYRSGAAPQDVAALLAQDPLVEYAEPKWAHRLSAVPNDPDYDTFQRAKLERMDFHQAWDLIKGEMGDVVIAMIDGGTDWDHNDLASNIWSNDDEIAGNGIDDDNNGFIDDVRGWNFQNDSNDPTGDLFDTPSSATHGTHTAGIVCAVANNSLQVTGASWNATLMPVNVAAPGADNFILDGYEGITYAASNGADVINCSWGSSGAPSVFEQEIIHFARDMGAVVVAAAGNGGANQSHFPSSYDGALSVANVSVNDVKASNSNFGPDIDVCAQGISIRSLAPNNSLAILSGTSMSSPHAAAVAALVKTQNPTWTPQQVLQQVRISAENIDSQNLQWSGLLGRGRVSAYRALTLQSPAIQISDISFIELLGDQDGIIERGEQLEITATVTNFLAAADNVNFTLSENSSWAGVPQGNASATMIDGGASAELTFVVNISINTPIQSNILFTIDITADGYSDKDTFVLTVLPVFVGHASNNIQTTVTSTGRLGYAVSVGGNGNDGVGFLYKESSSLLFEGAMMIGTDASHVSDGARNNNSNDDTDFATVDIPTLQRPGAIATEQSEATFDDSEGSSPLGVEVFQQSFQFAGAPDDDYIILRHTIRNQSGSPISGLRVGWFCDWDMDATSYETNVTGFDAHRDLGYTYDSTGGASGVYAGTSVLTSPGASGYRGIRNDGTGQTWGIYDNFTTAEKWESMNSGTVNPESGPADVSSVISTGPFDIPVGESIAVAFAFVAGDNLDDLNSNSEAAKAKWLTIEDIVPVNITDFNLQEIGGDVHVSWRTEDEQDLAGYRIQRSFEGGPFEYLPADILPNPERLYRFVDTRPAPGRYDYRIAEVTTSGVIQLHASREIVVEGAPLVTRLEGCYPNPFNPRTTLRFELASSAPVRLNVYDARGRLVRSLLHGQFRHAGRYTHEWDGLDDAGRPVASGVYLARLELPGRVFTQRMTLVK